MNLIQAIQDINHQMGGGELPPDEISITHSGTTYTIKTPLYSGGRQTFTAEMGSEGWIFSNPAKMTFSNQTPIEKTDIPPCYAEMDPVSCTQGKDFYLFYPHNPDFCQFNMNGLVLKPNFIPPVVQTFLKNLAQTRMES